MFAVAGWENDAWVWIGWAVAFGATVTALVTLVIVLVLTEDRRKS